MLHTIALLPPPSAGMVIGREVRLSSQKFQVFHLPSLQFYSQYLERKSPDRLTSLRTHDNCLRDDGCAGTGTICFQSGVQHATIKPSSSAVVPVR